MCFFRKLPHARHCKEVLCDDSLQKPLLGTILPREKQRFGLKMAMGIAPNPMVKVAFLANHGDFFGGPSPFCEIQN